MVSRASNLCKLDSYVFNELGCLHILNKEFKKAERIFKKSLRIDG